LLKITENGALQVYSDTSPCSLLQKDKIDSRIKLYDTVDFIDEFLMDRLLFTAGNEPVALHITCSATRMGQADKLKRIMSACSTQVVIPDQITCCGFAGDKGFSTPELNASALRTLKGAVQTCDAGYSTSRTCEIGLSHHSGIDYKSIIYLVDRCTQPKLSDAPSTEENNRIQAHKA
jgi:D-lactate dehydrogenase